METVNVTTQVPKESKEMFDAALGLIRHFKAGGDLAGAALLLPAVLKGVEGVEKIGGELSSAQNDELAGYVVQQVMDLLKPSAVVPTPAP